MNACFPNITTTVILDIIQLIVICNLWKRSGWEANPRIKIKKNAMTIAFFSHSSGAYRNGATRQTPETENEAALFRIFNFYIKIKVLREYLVRVLRVG